MDLGTAIVGALMLAIFTVPFVLSNRSRKNNGKLIKNSLFNLAEKVNSDITVFTQWHNTAIGMSTTSEKLFFYRKGEADEVCHSIDFQSIHSCKITKIARTLKSNNENYEIIDRLELIISTSIKNKQEIILAFYNADINTQMNGELNLIEDWHKKINALIVYKKQSA
jgi:hypothetical protein